jgi:hypothetical protein
VRLSIIKATPSYRTVALGDYNYKCLFAIALDNLTDPDYRGMKRIDNSTEMTTSTHGQLVEDT